MPHPIDVISNLARLNDARNAVVFDDSNYWIVSVIMEDGDVYQTLALFYEMNEAILLLHETVVNDGKWTIKEIVIV
jgi:hypothetical protein